MQGTDLINIYYTASVDGFIIGRLR